MYSVWGMGLTKNILQNVIGGIFHHLPKGGEVNNSQLNVIESNHEIMLNKVELKTGIN